MYCEWFVKCDRLADGVIAHPILGEVPCCIRCATRVDALDELVLG